MTTTSLDTTIARVTPDEIARATTHERVQARIYALNREDMESHEIVRNGLNALEEAVADLRKCYLAKVRELIEDGGPLMLPSGIYQKLGTRSDVKCVNKADTVKALLAACGGDVEALANYLGSQPFKHGSVRSLIGDEEWEKLFQREQKTFVDEKGEKKPLPAEVIDVDTRFIR